MSTSSSSSSGGIGIFGLMTVVFVTLKVLGKLPDWSWVWVLSPLWIGALIYLAIILIVSIFTVLVHMVKNR